MPGPDILKLHSPAKINLFLEVCGKRSDGFHELETVMLRTTLCDTITFEADDSGQLSLNQTECSAIDIPLDDSNLILRAARALLATEPRRVGAKITIDKRIPLQAGLAGGSSNAATTLLGLNQLWELNLPVAVLHEIAATLGSDINFFVEDCTAAVCRGRGELVTPIPVRGPFHFVAARPAAGNSTPDVFSKLTLPHELHGCDDVVAALKAGDAKHLTKAVFNRLTQPAMNVNAGMTRLIQQMQTETNRPVFMSGSGSTCFVVCDSESAAQQVQAGCSSLDAVFLTTLTSA
jgi:4-diphosphocytidyl-2-C-methyl-D-erythritol kinase